jgi:hypothetical protein
MLSKELQAKAKWVADMMKADGLSADQITEELCLAYFASLGKKIVQIQNIYLARNGAKQAMTNHIYSISVQS